MNTYMIDDKEVTFIELIEMACEFDYKFDNSQFKTTSKAAEILRGLGFSVKKVKRSD